MATILSVSQVNSYVKTMFHADPRLNPIYVRGELSNCKLHYSGHIYFSLKDESATIRCVMFRSNAQRLNFVPKDGMKLLVSGRLDVFERDGVYQLYAEHMVVDGVGNLAVAFEQLKEKLLAEGLFDEDNKKPIPQYPKQIGVITASTGAAIRDIINVSQRRWPCCKLVLYPVLVQGPMAAGQIAAALDYFSQSAVDTVIVGRGGGSMEDLWAFNEETVARAVWRCEKPVISAVGHETDVTICDFVADLRAPTPSAAAELAVPDLQVVLGRLQESRKKLTHIMEDMVAGRMERLNWLKERRPMKAPQALLDIRAERVALLTDKLTTAAERCCEEKETALRQQMLSLDNLSPLSVLSRGYAILQDEQGTAVMAPKQVKPGQELKATVKDGTISLMVKG